MAYKHWSKCKSPGNGAWGVTGASLPMPPREWLEAKGYLTVNRYEYRTGPRLRRDLNRADVCREYAYEQEVGHPSPEPATHEARLQWNYGNVRGKADKAAIVALAARSPQLVAA